MKPKSAGTDMSHGKLITSLVLLLAIPTISFAAADPADLGIQRRLSTTAGPFLTTCCEGCHSGPKPTAQLDLTNYAVRDLTGVDIQPAKEFPVDPANPAGFDNSGGSHDDLSDGYQRIAHFHLSQFAHLVKRLDEMPEGEGTVLDNWKHDNMKLPVVTAGGLGGTLQTGRALDYLNAGDETRKLCSLYLSIMDRMGVKLEHFGDADTRLTSL
jgi:hypothetical protein